MNLQKLLNQCTKECITDYSIINAYFSWKITPYISIINRMLISYLLCKNIRRIANKTCAVQLLQINGEMRWQIKLLHSRNCGKPRPPLLTFISCTTSWFGVPGYQTLYLIGCVFVVHFTIYVTLFQKTQ